MTGPCGDNYQGMTTDFANLVTPIQATYSQGDTLTIKVYLTSNHGGKFMFRICPRQTSLDEACFGTNYLTRVDNGEVDTWLLSGAAEWVMQYRCVLQDIVLSTQT